jgi:hypothetical protein
MLMAGRAAGYPKSGNGSRQGAKLAKKDKGDAFNV